MEELEKAAADPGRDRPFVDSSSAARAASFVKYGSSCRPLRVGLVAGEASGDTLGAGLIQALRRRAPDARILRRRRAEDAGGGLRGVGAGRVARRHGPVRGAARLPRLLRLARARARIVPAARPDVFVGIDAPDTNLRLARKLRAAGIPTVQYVSPQVWAWRQGRVRAASTSRWIWCCACCRSRSASTTSMASRAEFVGASARRCHSADRRPRGGARALGLPGGRRSSRCCPAAGAAK
jgi:hypothetical protein